MLCVITCIIVLNHTYSHVLLIVNSMYLQCTCVIIILIPIPLFSFLFHYPRSYSIILIPILSIVSDAITNVYYHPLSAARLKVNFTSPSILITHGIVLYYNITISLYEGTMVTTRQLPGNQSVIETEFDGLSKYTVESL